MKALLLLLTALVALLPTAVAAVYDVGPAFPMTMLQDVPWGELQPGDVVNIHTKPGGYHEKFQISEPGTAAQHIVIHGVPDPVTGALPIIDAKDAIEDPKVDYRASSFATFGLIVVSPRKTGYLYGMNHVSFVDIENLDLRNALYTTDSSITFTDQFGSVRPYNSFACGLYIEWARDLAVRGCEISHCCNGIFANSKNGAAQSSARLLIESNYLHDNSLPYTVDPLDPSHVISNGVHEHDCYIESVGVTYQYNHFGPMRTGCHGCAIKDRSSGIIIRYNDFDLFEDGSAITMLDPQGGAGYIETMPGYQEAYVYGNRITIGNYPSPVYVVAWAAQGGSATYAALHRGTLHYFNNTLVNHHNRVVLFSMTATDYAGSLPTYENVDCRNNIFFTDTAFMNTTYEKMVFSSPGATNGGGDINLNGPNWISPGWAKDAPGHAYGGQLNGVKNLVTGNAQGVNDPLFANVSARDYHVLTGSNVIDAAGPIAPAALALGHDDSLEYFAPQSFQPRTQLGGAMDLGAVESSGSPPAPPAGGTLQFNSAAYSAAESSGNVPITVTRSGGSVGAVSIAYNVSGGTATGGSDFVASSGVLNWPAGDLSPRTFDVSILNDTSPENAESVQLTLTQITGGAGYGTPSYATLTINDDDIPVSQPIIAVTGSGKLITFTTGAPGTILKNLTVTGITSPQTIRGLAFRRSTGQLYVVGAVGGTGPVAASLYRLNPATGALTLVADITSPLLAHPSFDLGIDPATDQLHLFGSTGQHLRLNLDTGSVIATDPALAFASGDAHFGAAPGIVGADFTPGLTPTVFGIDKTIDSLVRIGSVGGSPLSGTSGTVSTIGPLGVDTEGLTGLDFSPAGTAYAVLNPATGASSNLYIIDTQTGHATSLGPIGVAEQVRDLVVATPGDISFTSSSYSVMESQGTATIGVARNGGSWGPVSVDFSSTGGTATAADYTAAPVTLTWQDGETGIKTITIAITPDDLAEGDETVALTLSNATGGALLPFSATSTLVISDPHYQQWKFLNFGVGANDPLIAGDDISTTDDGIPNLLKYAFGLSAHAHAPAGLMSFDSSHAFIFQRDPGADDVTLTVEVSPDLIQWQAGSRYGGPNGDVPVNTWSTELNRQPDPASGFDRITVQINPSVLPNTFVRLRATPP